MRSAPQPKLKSVFVSRPGQGVNRQAVARRDDLLAAAVIAAGDTQDTKNHTRSVLARVQRRWSRISDSLWRRGRDERRVRDMVTPPVVVLDTLGGVAIDTVPTQKKNAVPQVTSHVILHRERHLKMKREEELEFDDELAVHSTNMRRVRQVGAREDDDTLLLLPRVVSLSFSSPGSKDGTVNENIRRVQLPRVSALMPMRASPRPSSALESNNPMSSVGNAQCDDTNSFSSQNSCERERNETWDVANSNMRRGVFRRLPTGLSNEDVEKEIDRAVVEIASDNGSDSDGSSTSPSYGMKTYHRKLVDFDLSKNARALSDAHYRSLVPRTAAFSRRITSNVQLRRKACEGGLAESLVTERSNVSHSQGSTLFEDDYLSFKGFHSSPSCVRQHHAMNGVLRGKRISSVTDSHSEESEESAYTKAMHSTDSQCGAGRSGILCHRIWPRYRSTANCDKSAEELLEEPRGSHETSADCEEL